MKIGIIGGGFGGLAAAIDLVDGGHEVTVFESEKRLGGLAIGFRDPGWPADSAGRVWSLERYYHHIFANDKYIIGVAKKVGLPAFFKVPKTNSFINGVEKQLDSPLSLLAFSDISFLSRLHMGVGLLLMKLIGNGIFLERFRVVEALPRWVGREGYEKVWKPLLVAKFGPYLPEVNLAWFWARVYKRTRALGYFPGGFGALADKMGEYIKKGGGKIKLGVMVRMVKQEKGGAWWVNDEKFDRVLVTTPAPLTDKLVGLGKVRWPKINYLWAQTLVLELEQSLMKGYWLNVLEKDFPFLVVVEQTNFVDKSHYGNKTIVYLGNYLAGDDKRLKMTAEKLLSLCLPFLQKINPAFEKKWIRKSWYFEAPYAQPVFPIGYSRQLSAVSQQPVAGLYVANMTMVYPWDRGTNYAIEAGQKVAQMIKDGR